MNELISDFDQAIWGGVSINGVFNNNFYPSSMQEGIVETSSPEFTCKTSDVPGVAHGNEITINNKVYKVIGVQPDNAGLTTLILSREGL